MLSSGDARHCRPVRGPRGAVAAAHPLAVSAGVRALDHGGSAVDAALAAQAVLCVVAPQACGLGGDMLALVRTDDGMVVAVNGTGAAPAGRLAGNLTDGGGSVLVPGLVDGWVTTHRRWGRLSLAELLEPAWRLASHGLVVDDDLASAVSAQRSRLLRGGAEGWPLLLRPAGTLWQQPELATALGDIAGTDGESFYQGPLAAAIEVACARDGGTLTVEDLAAHQTPVVAPVATAWAGGTAYVQPPSSQGVLLAMALRWLERHGADLDLQTPSGAVHVLVELIGAAFSLRDRSGEGAGLLAENLEVELSTATRRTGPRAYLHTAGVATADSTGMVVSSLISVFDDFGSGTFVPEGGFTLNNRAGGFTTGPNAPACGARPVHTLAPALLVGPDGTTTAMATPGADGQVQTLLQVLASQRYAGADLASALAAPRWRSQDGQVLVEAGHPGAGQLSRRGHLVQPRPAGADLFGAVVVAGHDGTSPFAAADWRRTVWSGAL